MIRTFTYYIFILLCLTTLSCSEREFDNPVDTGKHIDFNGNLAITGITDTTIQLKWQCNYDNISEFEIVYSSDDNNYTLMKTIPGNCNTVILTGNYYTGSSYFFKIRGRIDQNYTSYSNNANVKLRLDAPSNLTVTNLSETSIQINWFDNSNFETEFILERSENSGTYSVIAQIPANNVSFTDNYLNSTSKYSYRIKAVSSLYQSSYSQVMNINININGSLIRTLTGHQSVIVSVSFSPDRFSIVSSGSFDQTVKIWNISDGSLKSSYNLSSLIQTTSLSPDGQTIAMGGYNNSVSLWRISDGSNIRTMTGHTYAVNSVSFSPDGSILASASSDNTIKIWRTSDGSLIRTLTGHQTGVSSVIFSPDGSIIASSSYDNTIILWRTSDGSLIRSVIGHSDYINSVIAFSPDGQTIISNSNDNTIKLWRTSDGNLIRTLYGHTDIISSLSFSPDGKTIASGSRDKTIKIWGTADWIVIKTLTGHSDDIRSVAFNQDSKILASGSDDKTIKLWSLEKTWQITP
jgi:WD40 repeat protein